MKTRQAQPKLFAFKLASKKADPAKTTPQWQARASVAVAGCTFPAERYARVGAKDNGVYC
ncbi:hypothetical protein [Massilia sp. NR 4-1]|uniref:hypothetical protein n=1 Tax=Massilia sp. NR 4-1 TaxID=1678028 RepID=UPI00067DAA89|nr:hypothetical protein [Massilia sp. NR 4-1]AKU21617.1 hypothetical protein ACZ75_09205 [Massilia sp. NR 4-1]